MPAKQPSPRTPAAKPLPLKPPPQELAAKRVYFAVGGAVGFAAFLMTVALLTLGGPRATVSGRVLHNGKPVIWGSVVLVSADGKAVAGRIGPDGTYTVDNAPATTVAVAVISKDPLLQQLANRYKVSRERLSAKQVQPLPIDRKKWFPLPKHYEDPKTSGLSLSLSRGTNTYDLNLH